MVNGQQIFQLLALMRRENNSAMQTILDLSEKCSEIRKNWENSPAGSSFQINVIKSAAIGKLKENAHSRILHDLLKVNDKRILDSFIKEVAEIPDFDFNPEDVDTPDHNRIDLSIRSSKGFLIIENKVNDAEEQRGQLYRYYHYVAKQKVRNNSHIKILYLNSSDHTMPSLYSRSKEGKGKEEDKETIKTDLINVKDYKHDILYWLKNLLLNEEIFNEKELLKSAITQYIDYLEDFFELKEIYKTLHIEMEKEILKELNLDGLSEEEKINQLQTITYRLSILQTEIDRMISQLKNKIKTKETFNDFSKLTNELNDQYQNILSFYISPDRENPEIYFLFKYQENDLTVSLVLWKDSLYYWRIYGNKSFKENERDILKNTVLNSIDNIINTSPQSEWGLYKSFERMSDAIVSFRILIEKIVTFLKN